MTRISKEHGIEIETCAERANLTEYGIGNTHCIDTDLIKSLKGKKVSYVKDLAQRPICGCCKSIDIGAYEKCKNGCVYCYTNK